MIRRYPATISLALAVVGGLVLWLLNRHDHVHNAADLGLYWTCGVLSGAGIIVRRRS